ncbi:MAG: GTP 3',8-cyclase MoaA [Anaerolineae bacterium]|nr:GTP 3',8-cyclase MoaA [Anaerolineae bacterium]
MTEPDTATSTLQDRLGRPFRDLRISVTDRCNFRCTYCMPEEVFGERYRFLPKSDLLTFEEIARVARILIGLGARKIRLTGGEPLVRHEIERLVAQLAALDGLDDLAMTTNGFLLGQRAEALRDAGLKRVTVSLDSLDDATFRRMNGGKASVAQVLEGIAAAQRAGLTPIKVNAVVQRGVNDHALVDLARFCRERGYIARFIEYMDVGNLNGWRREDVVPAAEIVARIDAALPLEPIPSNYPGEVASRFRFRDGSGEIGVIASVTQPFCGSCTRLRLSPEGQLYTCLFGTRGTDLRGPLRAGAPDEALAALVSGVWRARTDRYSEMRASVRTPREKVEMYHIGG